MVFRIGSLAERLRQDKTETASKVRLGPRGVGGVGLGALGVGLGELEGGGWSQQFLFGGKKN